jgi:adenylyl- and sulfurtransferase ThiI
MDPVKRKELAPIIAAIKKQKKLDDPIYAARMKENEAKASKLAADAVMEKYGVKSWFSIMNVDPVFKEKRKERLKELQHQQGEKNSQFGTCWVSSKAEQRAIKIPKDQLDHYIGLGWNPGRKL